MSAVPADPTSMHPYKRHLYNVQHILEPESVKDEDAKTSIANTEFPTENQPLHIQPVTSSPCSSHSSARKVLLTKAEPPEFEEDFNNLEYTSSAVSLPSDNAQHLQPVNSKPISIPDSVEMETTTTSSRYQDTPPFPQNSHSRSQTSVLTGSSTDMHYNSATSQNLRSIRDQKSRSRSVDLSHMYLLSDSQGDTQLTSTNESVADLSHQMISNYLGSENNSSLLPRLKTIEMYRQNVKKSKDPHVLFQYSQYMLQTALTIESSSTLISNGNNNLGDTHSNREKVTSDDLKRQFLKEAQHYLKKLSAKGYSDAQYLLADAYSSGVFGKVENKESFILFQAAAKHGHVESAYRASHCLEEGLGTTRDSRKALNFLKFAASRNHPSAMFKLGLYSFYGKMGLPNDVNTKQNGIKWLSRAAARANELTCAAPYELAKIFEKGFLDIIIPDEKYAMELYIQAATLGHVPSACLLGKIYETGNSVVPQDVSLSVHYYTQAALQGDPVAMLGLCAWYILGAEPAFARDEAEAFQWALKAANCGLPKAQFTLGYFYESGKGCEMDYDQAWKWYEKAAKNNYSRAIQKIKRGRKYVTTDGGVGDGSPNAGANNLQGGVASGNLITKHGKNKSVNTINLFAADNEYEDGNTGDIVDKNYGIGNTQFQVEQYTNGTDADQSVIINDDGSVNSTGNIYHNGVAEDTVTNGNGNAGETSLLQTVSNREYPTIQQPSSPAKPEDTDNGNTPRLVIHNVPIDEKTVAEQEKKMKRRPKSFIPFRKKDADITTSGGSNSSKKKGKDKGKDKERRKSDATDCVIM